MAADKIFLRPARKEDLPLLARIEEACFPAAEAASLSRLTQRFEAFPEWFLAAQAGETLVGLIDGASTSLPAIADCLYEDASLHEPFGENQTVFGLAVLPEFQGRGIGGRLLEEYCVLAQKRGKTAVLLTCKAEKRPFYSRFGFVCEGVSQSVHGGAVWYDMKRPLPSLSPKEDR